MGQNKNIFERNISETRFEGKISSASFSGSLTASSAKKNSDYEMLSNKPHINGVELVGDKSFSELGFPEMTEYAKLTDIPSMLPANGGDADTVNGHTVNSDIPENAVFTDTTHSDISAEGCILQLGGLQGNVPFSEITVSGKNLLKYPYMTESGKVTSGVTFTANSDGSITLNGTSTAYGSFNFTSRLTKDLLLNGTYTLSGATADAKLTINATRDGKATTIIRTQSSSIFTTSYHDNDNEYGFAVFVEFDTGKTFDNLTIFPQLEIGSVATDYKAPITGRELTLNACGKNLIPYPYLSSTRTTDGISWTDNGDGSVTANGTATKQIWFTLFTRGKIKLKAGTYTLSGTQSGGRLKYDTNLIWTDSDGNKHWCIDYGQTNTFTIPDCDNVQMLFRIYPGITVENVLFRPQLELGAAATDYEPYHGSTVKITPDSNPYAVPNDIRQQDGLNVVSVSDGTLSVTGVRKNLALKRIWDKIDEITTAVIVANGEN